MTMTSESIDKRVKDLRARAVVFANAAAGSSDLLGDETEARLRALCRNVHLTASVDELAATLKALFEQVERPLLVPAGGDGTVNTIVNVASEIAADRFDLAVLPLGTGNDLARTFEIPLSLPEAIDCLTTGVFYPLDLWCVKARDKSRIMINSLALGQPATVGKETDETQKKREGTWSYLKNGTRLFANEPLHFSIRLNAEPAFAKTGSGLIFINGQTIAGGLRISPQGDPSDGNLELKVLEGEGWGDQMLSKVLVFFGTDQEGRSYNQISSASVESIETVEASIDGEVNYKLPLEISHYGKVKILGPVR